MKRFMSVLLAFVLVFSLTAPAAAADQVQKATLTVDKQKVYKGEDVTVTLSMDKTITNMTAWQFNIYFDGDKFTMKSSSVAAGAYKTTTVGNAGDRGNQGMYVPVSALDVQGLPVQLLAGDVCSITFTAKKDAEVGNAEFRVACIDLYDYDDITTNMKGQCGIENVTVTVAEKPAETSAYKVVRDSEQDEPLTADIGDTVEVRFNVQGLAKNETTWNGASAKFTYDASALEFVEANHVFGDNGTVDSSKAGVVTVQGFTEESRTSDAAPLAILTFRAKGNAVSKVEVAEAKIWNEAKVPDDTVPAVTEVESATVVSGEVTYGIKVTGDGAADVTLPVQQVKAGGAFAFQITEDGTSRYDITVTVGGENVTPIKTSSRYVVRGVTGEVVINVTKAYRVNVEGNAAEDVAPSADYFYGDEENIITVSKQDGYDYTIVIKSGDTVLDIKDNDGEFVIPAGSIKGTVTVTANKTKQVTGSPYRVVAKTDSTNVTVNDEVHIYLYAESTDSSVTTYNGARLRFRVSDGLSLQNVLFPDGEEYTDWNDDGDDLVYVMTRGQDKKVGKDYFAELVLLAEDAGTKELTLQDAYVLAENDLDEDASHAVKDVKGLTLEVAHAKYAVTVTGSGKDDVVAAATAEDRMPFTFTVNKKAGYDYTVTAKSAQAVVMDDNGDGTYTIRENYITGPVTITVEKTKQVTYTVSAMPATQEVEAGKEFSIMPIASSSDTGVNCTSVEMDVNYDTAKAELVQAAVNSGTYTTGTGVVHIQADNLSAAMIKVGRIQFKALAAGTTKITLTNVKVNGAAATTADATVTITAAPTPDPVYTLTMSPETQTAQVGDSVKVSVALTAENAETYGVLGMQMTYDADKLEYVGATTTSANVQGRANAGTLTVKCAGESRAIAGTVVTLEFKALAAGDSKLTITNSTVDGAAAAAANTASVSVTEPETKTVYTASLTTDTTAASYDEEIRVLVKPGSENDQNATFDGSALQIRYDSSKLEYDYLDTPYHESDVDIRVDEENGVITVSGFGGRDLPVAKVPYVAAVTFKAKAAGTGTVTLDSAALTAEHALPGTEDAAKILNGSVSVEITVPDYTVTKPDYVLGAEQATAGADYTFTLANPNLYNYSGVLVYVNDMLTDVNHNADGSYTVPGNCVTGNMKIVVTQLVKSFTVAVTGSGAADVTAAGKAAYGKDFTFTVRKAAGYTYTITAKIGENAIPVAEDNGSCTISGSDITGNVTITVTKQEETPVTTAYGIYVDPKTQDAMVNENVELKVKVSSEDSATFNAYTAKIAYDATRLTLKNVECPDSEENTSWKDEDGVVTLLGFGNNKPVDKAYVAILSFTTKAPGTAEVTILEAAVDHKNNAPDKDTPAATVTGNGVINITGTYKVTLDAGLTADESVATTGKDYIFKATDSNHYDYAPVATINGSQITVIDNHDGTYTIPGAQIVGEIDVKANRTPKTYEVTVTGTGAGDVKAEKNAVYNTNYTFTVTKDGSYTYTVTAKIGNQAVALSEGGNGSYTITGTAITGDITITVEKTLKPVTSYPVEKPDYVTGADTAEKGKDYNFTVTTEPGYSYGEPEVTVGGEKVEITKNDDGSYTIPGDKITGKIVIRVERTKALDVEVSQYLQLNGKTMWLVTTTAELEDGQTALYDGQAMFHSEAYGAYAWLVISDKSLEDVKAEAAKLVTAGTGKPVEIDYNGDVNMTGKVDVNDAQLVYDMYQAAYEDFTTVSMEKFLRADTNLSKTVDTSDTAKLIADMTRN